MAQGCLLTTTIISNYNPPGENSVPCCMAMTVTISPEVLSPVCAMFPDEFKNSFNSSYNFFFIIPPVHTRTEEFQSVARSVVAGPRGLSPTRELRRTWFAISTAPLQLHLHHFQSQLWRRLPCFAACHYTPTSSTPRTSSTCVCIPRLVHAPYSHIASLTHLLTHTCNCWFQLFSSRHR